MSFHQKRPFRLFLLLLALLFLGLAACTPAEETTVSEADTESEENAVASPLRDGASGADEDAATSESEPEFSSPLNLLNGDNSDVLLDDNGIEVGFTEDGRPYRGNPDAPVVMEEFSDFQCPFCARFVSETMPSIEAEQIANGEVVLIFYDFPLNIHPQAPAAANAARCAGEQSAHAFWQMHDLLFENVGEWSHNDANRVFIGYGEQLDLDMAHFAGCVEENKYEEAIEADYRYGQSRGVSSTPSFFINDQPFIGAQPLAAFNEAITQVAAGNEIATVERSSGDLPPDFAPPTPAAIPVEAENVAWAVGDPEAPVQIVEYTDYQCPYCQGFATETMPTLLEEMVETGRVYLVIKDLPLDQIHPEAIVSATAVRCAGEQDAYLPMHDAVFAEQNEWGGLGEAEATTYFASMAVDLGLDETAFNACMENGRQRENVLANQAEAFRFGVSSTPSFFVDGYMMRGAQPFDVFEAVIEIAEAGELANVIEEQARQAYAAQQQQEPARPSGPVDIPIEDAYAIGDPEAPVTIIEYTDYQCPFCSRHFDQTFSLIKENFIDTGRVRYVFKDFPLTQIHPQAVAAAEAARCAGDQDAYLEMHDVLFQNQDAWSGQSDAASIFNGYAAELGLDTDTFAACLENRTHQAAVMDDLDEGISFGVSGTPAFFINGYFISGAQPYQTFADAIQILATETD